MAVCYKFNKLINKYIDGEIEKSDKKSLDEHLSVCSSCKTFFEKSNRLKKTLSSLHQYKTSSTFDVELRARLKNEMNKNSFFNLIPEISWQRKTPAFAAFALLLVISGIYIGNSFNIINTTGNAPRLVKLNRLPQSQTSVSPAAVNSYNVDNYLKMKNYVNVAEQFPAANRDAIALANSGELEQQLNATEIDSLRRYKNNKLAMPLIKQANATIHF